MRTTVAFMALVFSACVGTAWAQPSPTAAKISTSNSLNQTQHKVHSEAVAAFRAHRYAAAFGRFAALADAGHVPSAEAALFMAKNGMTLFGSDWYASPQQLAQWQAMLVNGARNYRVIAEPSNLE